MARAHMFQRLNRHPKHTWAMLRNLLCDLLIHERIRTTKARGKCLIPLANKFIAAACHENKQMNKRWMKDILYKPEAYDKLMNNITFRFR